MTMPAFVLKVGTVFACRLAIRARTAKTESGGRRANPEVALDRLLDALMEPAGREARRKAAETIRRP